MKGLLGAAVICLSLTAAGYALAQSTPASCSEARGICASPGRNAACDVACVKYCADQYQACMRSGNFSTRRLSWKGLKKS